MRLATRVEKGKRNLAPREVERQKYYTPTFESTRKHLLYGGN